MKIHPAANLFPMLGAEDLASLAADIGTNGQREPIILFEEKILDGRNRYAACKIVKVEPRTKVLAKCDSPTAYVLSLNMHRRHLTPIQRAAVAAEAAPMFAKEAKDRQREGGRTAGRGRPKGSVQSVPNLSKGKSTHQAAIATKAGIQATRILVAVRAKAPDVFEAVKAGIVESGADARRLAEMNPAKRGRILEQMAEPDARPGLVREAKFAEARAAVAAEARRAPERACIRRADVVSFLDSIEDRSVDLLLTDPPYMTDVEDVVAFAAEWVPLALSKVKPTGRAYICTGSYPVELAAYLEVFLASPEWAADLLVWTYRNTIGPAPTHDYKRNWQAVFHLRGEGSQPLDCPIMLEQFSVQDINAPDGRQGDRFHSWQKPLELAERFVRHSTKAGDLVVDPFAGTGTFLIAAATLGRRAIGCDTDPDAVRIAVERGCVEIEGE